MLGWGAFVTEVVSFVILAFIIFLMVRWATRLMKKQEEAAGGPSEVELKKAPGIHLEYTLPESAAPASAAKDRPRFRLDAKSYFTTVLYKLYADSRNTKFWAAKGRPEPYDSGGWGPASADAMLARDGRAWRLP